MAHPCTTLNVCLVHGWKNFKWLKSMGGISEIEKLNNQKAKKLYSYRSIRIFIETE